MLALSCSGASAGESATAACASEPILGGNAQPGSIPFDAALENTLGSLVIPNDGGAEPTGDVALCSVVFVSARAALTARHCALSQHDSSVMGRDPLASAEVVRGSPLDPTARTASVARVWSHPELDIALLQLAMPVTRAPIPLLDEPMGDEWSNASVELAGYGFSRDEGLGVLQFATEQIEGLESDRIVVSGDGHSGACKGDSGGPLFGSTPSGEPRVIGVLQGGAPSCAGTDYYTRVDRLLDWAPLVTVLAAKDSSCVSD
ncbi:MAG TPA: trypsin-like serine protease [Polyangiaceae bacterium]|nr:trypsin-like serine protease [Polyangiaceae bacterium]